MRLYSKNNQDDVSDRFEIDLKLPTKTPTQTKTPTNTQHLPQHLLLAFQQ